MEAPKDLDEDQEIKKVKVRQQIVKMTCIAGKKNRDDVIDLDSSVVTPKRQDEPSASVSTQSRVAAQRIC